MVPKWESELWSYLSKGDGNQCPLYDHCQTRKESGCCFDGHVAEIRQLLEDTELDSTKCNLIVGKEARVGKPFQLVERLACKYLKKGKVHSPPVPTELASLLNTEDSVETHIIPLKTYHGAIWQLKGRWVIQLRRGDTPAMKRCTLFHEAFHILAHRKGAPVFRKRGTEVGYFNEGLADYFAVCILMPRGWVKGKWAEVKDVDRMAKIFSVPRTAMWNRLRLLGLV